MCPQDRLRANGRGRHSGFLPLWVSATAGTTMGVASCFIRPIADVSRHSPALHSPASGDLIRFGAVARGRNNRICWWGNNPP